MKGIRVATFFLVAVSLGAVAMAQTQEQQVQQLSLRIEKHKSLIAESNAAIKSLQGELKDLPGLRDVEDRKEAPLILLRRQEAVGVAAPLAQALAFEVPR